MLCFEWSRYFFWFRIYPFFSRTSETVPSWPTTTGITIIFRFHSFSFSSQARTKYLFIVLLSFIFNLWSTGMTKYTKLLISLRRTRSRLLAGIRWSVCISKSQENFIRLILSDEFLFLHIPFICPVQFWYLAQFIENNLSTPFCLVLHIFFANLQHSLMLLTVSSLSP